MTKRIGIVAVFLAGCAVGGASSQLVVPKASAQQEATLTKWEYLCLTDTSWKELRQGMNPAGAQGWELVSHTYQSVGGTTACFKRPKL